MPIASGPTSLGLKTVTTSGTPVQISSARLLATSVFIQAWTANTGRIWVGTSGMNIATGAAVLGYIAAPSLASAPAMSFIIPGALNGFDISELWLDADEDGDGAIVSYLEGHRDY